ncbi:MAG: type II toxin-antitoxin system HicA family toxin [Parcubacteria group bacterium]|nr:type II toxin-antitoxin system HicA family toxin [Parcubacteria group bacterium]
MGIIPILKAKDLLLLLLRLGFKVIHQKGSHVKLRHSIDATRQVIIPMHNKDLGRGVLLSILKQAKINFDDFLKLLGRK